MTKLINVNDPQAFCFDFLGKGLGFKALLKGPVPPKAHIFRSPVNTAPPFKH